MDAAVSAAPLATELVRPLKFAPTEYVSAFLFAPLPMPVVLTCAGDLAEIAHLQTIFATLQHNANAVSPLSTYFKFLGAPVEPAVVTAVEVSVAFLEMDLVLYPRSVMSQLANATAFRTARVIHPAGQMDVAEAAERVLVKTSAM